MLLEMPAEVAASAAVQLRLIADDGYAGPDKNARRSAPCPAAPQAGQLAGAAAVHAALAASIGGHDD